MTLPTTVNAFDYQFKGVTDEVTSCYSCGRTHLKKTVVLRPVDGGNYTYMGTTCAAHALRERGHNVTAGKVAMLADIAQMQHQVAADHATRIIEKYGVVYGAPVRLQARTFFGFNRHMATTMTPKQAAEDITDMMRWAYDVMGWDLPELAPARGRTWTGSMVRACDVCPTCHTAYDTHDRCMC